MTWAEAHNYVRSLNRTCFGGFKDWRLPAFIELSSLYGSYNYIHVEDLRGYYMEPYFAPVFDEKQLVCWSCDTATPGEFNCQTIGFREKPNGHLEVKVPHGAVWVYNYSDNKLSSPEGEIATAHRSSKYWVRAVRSLHTSYANYDHQQRELWERGRRDRNLAYIVNNYQTNERTKHWSYEKCVKFANDFLDSGHSWPVD
jgi:hypothetical protein